jgi:hypothetical protein
MAKDFLLNFSQVLNDAAKYLEQLQRFVFVVHFFQYQCQLKLPSCKHLDLAALPPTTPPTLAALQCKTPTIDIFHHNDREQERKNKTDGPFGSAIHSFTVI